ncbi:MAG: hypothetical protein ACLSAF_04470 [Intestinimonas sp.]
MSFWEWFLIAVGLSMDAFAVSICKGPVGGGGPGPPRPDRRTLVRRLPGADALSGAGCWAAAFRD